MTTCKNCNAEVNFNYCPDCGKPSNLKRIDRHYIMHEIEHVLHLERGILYSVRELLISPGRSVRHFITEDRSRLVKPVIFIIITSLVYSLLNHFFHIEDEYVEFNENQKTTTGLLFNWVQGHYGYANIIMGIFIAFWAKVFFRKYHYNLFEILILLCFVMGMGMLFMAVFAVIEGVAHLNVMSIAGYLVVIYSSWAIGQFFDGKKAGNYIKALASYILGMLSFLLLIVAAGSLIDAVIRH